MSTLPKEIVVRRVPKAGYFGLTSYPKSVTSLGAEIAKGGFKTGLTSEEEKFYEEKLGLKAGQLSRNSKWWSDVFNVEHSIRLFNTKSTTFDLEGDNWINQLKYKVLVSSSKIANSEIEKNKPNVDFYIVDEEAKAKIESEIFDYEWEGMELVLKLSPDEKRASLRLFGKKGVETLSETVIKAELTKELKKDPRLFVETLKDKKLKTRLVIEEMLEYRVITRKGNSFYNGDDVIAVGTDDCIEFFEDMKNQSVVLSLNTRLKKAKKG